MNPDFLLFLTEAFLPAIAAQSLRDPPDAGVLREALRRHLLEEGEEEGEEGDKIILYSDSRYEVYVRRDFAVRVIRKVPPFSIKIRGKTLHYEASTLRLNIGTLKTGFRSFHSASLWSTLKGYHPLKNTDLTNDAGETALRVDRCLDDREVMDNNVRKPQTAIKFIEDAVHALHVGFYDVRQWELPPSVSTVSEEGEGASYTFRAPKR